jgi:HlyD family secretion protein
MKRWIVIVIALVIIVGAGALVNQTMGGEQPPATPTPQAEEEEAITAKALVVPARQAKLSFKVAGRLLEILPEVGDQVQAGQVLARLDPRDFDLQVKAAEDALALNQALLAQVKAKARPQDLAAAQAAYEAALAAYNELLKKPKAADLAAAEGAVRDAQVALENARKNREVVRSSTTVAKAVRDAENEVAWYEGQYGRTLQRFKEGNASQEELDRDYANLLTAKEKLEVARQNAAIALATADNNVKKAEDALRQAQTRLEELKAGPKEDQVKAAEARLKEAKARLDRLRSGPSQEELAVARARVEQARTALEQARAARESARLVAPFAGQVASILGHEGELVTPATPILVLADLRELRLETKDLDEITVARLSIGQKVKVTVNAFENKVLSGWVSLISPMASFNPIGDPVYAVTITLDQQDPELRWGMTTKVEFEGG